MILMAHPLGPLLLEDALGAVTNGARPPKLTRGGLLEGRAEGNSVARGVNFLTTAKEGDDRPQRRR